MQAYKAVQKITDLMRQAVGGLIIVKRKLMDKMSLQILVQDEKTAKC